jgi:tRNA pseudouridine38-40 synthase
VARFRLTLEYEGTRYRGWQVQKNARTVAGEIGEAVRRLSGRTDFELYGSGRTDAGVHALAQVAHLDLNTALDPQRLVYALNDELPADINVLQAERVPRRFHARHDAVARSYLYQVSRRRTALGKPFVWWVKDPLDAALMREAARALVGLHNFRSFAET